MIKKLIRYLYYKFCDPDLVKMTRTQLGLFNKPVDFSILSYDEQQDYYLYADELLKNDHFNFIVDNLIQDVKEDMFYKTEADNIIYDRFTINGIHLLKERLHYMAMKIKEQEEQYDKHSVT